MMVVDTSGSMILNVAGAAPSCTGYPSTRLGHAKCAVKNTVLAFGSVPGLPFGGVGESGFGRIHGDEGLREFSRTKSTVEQRFSLPMNPFTFRTPPNLYDQLKGMAEKLYGSAVLDKAGEVLKRFGL